MRDSKDDGRHTWATWVRNARASAGLSQAKLARRMDVSRNTISRWEIGSFVPNRPEDALALARATGVSADDTLAAAGFRPEAPSPQPPEPLDSRLRILRDHLSDPDVSDDEKRLIEAQLEHLAEVARRLRKTQEEH